ncbi:MAG: hypothetical protein QOF41_1434 [Methylobacteriaceae bacterium]|nr:hypothetical protein [Methylobacteriaceae bacterium]
MLRFDYMHSDFHPIFLFLGEAEDLLQLARLLRGFARDPKEIPCETPFAESPKRVRLALAPSEDIYGMREVADGAFKWQLNAWQAERIAERIDALAKPENKSGSEIIELGSEGEVPVKVSRGEFTDDFLIKVR